MSKPITERDILRDCAYIIKVLKKLGYHDANAISLEVLDYSEKNNEPLREIVAELETNKPWEYIKKEAQFLDYSFYVDESVLIPRVETEQLVEFAFSDIEKFLLESIDTKVNIIDVGTGSGAIIISLAILLEKFSDRIDFYATDISGDALDIAKENELLLLPRRKIKFNNDNLITNTVSELDSRKTFIIANLPYIPTSIVDTLQPSVKDFEPRLALDGGNDGCDLYRQLLKQAQSLDFHMYWEFDPETTGSIDDLTNDYQIKKQPDQFGLLRFIKISPK